jgi:hypothetical protein
MNKTIVFPSPGHRRPGVTRRTEMPIDASPQMELLPLNPVNRVLGQSLEEQFDAFHLANPHVYAALRSLARELKRRGAKKAGISQLFEVLRWQYALQTKGSEYRLNNNYRSFYPGCSMKSPSCVACSRRGRCAGRGNVGSTNTTRIPTAL